MALDANVIAAISAVASAIAAFAAMFQVRKAAQATEAAAYLKLLESYSTVEMRMAVSELSKLWREASAKNMTVVEYYRQIEGLDEDAASEIRHHCRVISSYFVDSYRLYQAKLITEKLLKLAIAHPGLNTFYEVAVPLNQDKNGGHNSVRASQSLQRIVSKHGNGIY